MAIQISLYLSNDGQISSTAAADISERKKAQIMNAKQLNDQQEVCTRCVALHHCTEFSLDAGGCHNSQPSLQLLYCKCVPSRPIMDSGIFENVISVLSDMTTSLPVGNHQHFSPSNWLSFHTNRSIPYQCYESLQPWSCGTSSLLCVVALTSLGGTCMCFNMMTLSFFSYSMFSPVPSLLVQPAPLRPPRLVSSWSPWLPVITC